LLVGASLPPIQSALQITGLGWQGWALAFAVSFVATFWMELQKILRKSA